MFLKNVSCFRRLSIAARLSILYAITSGLMLLMLSLYAYWTLTDTLSNANQKFLSDEVRVFRNILLKHPENHKLLEQEVEWVPEELEASEYHYYARITDKANNLYAITAGMSSLFKGVTFPVPANINEAPEETEIWKSKAGNTYLLISALAKDGKTNSLRLIEIALDISPQQQIIAKYRNNLLIVLILGMVFASLLGVFVARKGMASLKKITRYAEAISVSKLNAIDIGHSPKELRNLTHAFNNMLQRIENAYKKLSLVSNELAHELRTPINNLMGEAEIILSKDRSLLEYKEVITSSHEEYQRITRMIESILFLARTENPSAKLHYQLINLHSEFQNTAELFEPLVNEKNISLQFQSNSHQLYAEPNLFRRALNNLVSNAIRYTQEGGKILISSEITTKEIIVCVEDDGIGIAAEHIPYICNRFYRVKREEFSPNYGLGLGLAIVKSIMDLHKGAINLASTLGSGTRVQLSFPSIL